MRGILCFNSRLREEATLLCGVPGEAEAGVSTHASVRRRPSPAAAAEGTFEVSTHASVRRRPPGKLKYMIKYFRFNSRLREEATVPVHL